MAPVPEHWTFRLVPPAQHQIDLIATPIDLQFKILIGATLAVDITAFNPHVQIVDLFWSRRIDQNNSMAPGLEANVSRLGNQHQKVYGLRARRGLNGSAPGWTQRETPD